MSRAKIYKEPEHVYFIKSCIGSYTGPYMHKRPIKKGSGDELVKYKIIRDETDYKLKDLSKL